MKKRTIIKPSQLSNEQARGFLIMMDQEAFEFWKNTTANDLVRALQDNLCSFGDFNTDKIILKADQFKNIKPFQDFLFLRRNVF